MDTQTSNVELTERLKLIENMIAEGRRGQESWGWSFVLWGVAYFIATAWATCGHSDLAWPVTMIAAAVVTGVAASRMSRGRPETVLGRAIGAVWTAMGVCLFVLLLSLSIGGLGDGRIFVSIIGAMLGMAHAASAIILKWKMQFACAIIWLAAAVTSVFGTDNRAVDIFLAATFFGQVVFGIYAMILESRRRRERGVAHA
ncbi:MAG: hypothetical protein WBC92_16980 [Terracidiphilus sp.]